MRKRGACAGRSRVGPRLIGVILQLACVVGAGPGTNESCPAVSSSEQSSILAFVREEFGIPAAVPLVFTDEGIVKGACLERVHIQSGEPSTFFDLHIVVLPDHAFIAADVRDVRVSPYRAQLEKETEVGKRLAHGDRPVKGKSAAPVSIVVFTDFQCPYCRALHHNIALAWSSIKDDARLLYRYFPLAMHPWARDAAGATACASHEDADVFWRLIDSYFESQPALTRERVLGSDMQLIANIPGPTWERIQRCAKSVQGPGEVGADIELGIDVGVAGTPAVFVNGRPISVSAPADLVAAVARAKSDLPVSRAAGEQTRNQR